MEVYVEPPASRFESRWRGMEYAINVYIIHTIIVSEVQYEIYYK